MKEIKKEQQHVEYITYYEAFDGTTFQEKCQCEAYENSASGVVIGKLHEIGTVISNQDWLDCGDGENWHIFVVPTKQEHLDILNQLMFLCRASDEKTKLFFTENDLNKPFIMGYRSYNNSLDWSWFYKIEDIISQATNDTYTIVKK